jgi:hypothetical protein
MRDDHIRVPQFVASLLVIVLAKHSARRSGRPSADGGSAGPEYPSRAANGMAAYRSCVQPR